MSDLGNWGQHGTLTDAVPYGQHVDLCCKNHPELWWSTKNIAPIGARTIFFVDWPKPECDCPISDLQLVSEQP
jgi:hypothetical protein